MPRSLADQVASVRAEMETRPEGLVAHVRRVLDEALILARAWDLDPARVELATWGHDLFRAHAPEEQLRLAREAGVPVLPEDEASPVLLHGPIAAAVLRERFAVEDEDALAAVRDHTLGRPDMPLIARALLLADKVEARKRRGRKELAAIRDLARRDLDLAVLCWADARWVEERTNGWLSHPGYWAARTAWVAAHHAEAGLPKRRPAATSGS
jgi:predicted HD superfamily hydrolase involved in NAD metabolism